MIDLPPQPPLPPLPPAPTSEAEDQKRADRKLLRRAVDKLKLPAGKWNTDRLVTVDQFGKWLRPKRVADYNLTEALLQLEQLDFVLDRLQKKIKDSDACVARGGLPDPDYMTALKLIPETVTAHQRLAAHVLAMSEKSHANEPGERKRNLPPVLHFNQGSGPVTVSIPAISGNNGNS